MTTKKRPLRTPYKAWAAFVNGRPDLYTIRETVDSARTAGNLWVKKGFEVKRVKVTW